MQSDKLLRKGQGLTFATVFQLFLVQSEIHASYQIFEYLHNVNLHRLLNEKQYVYVYSILFPLELHGTYLPSSDEKQVQIPLNKIKKKHLYVSFYETLNMTLQDGQ